MTVTRIFVGLCALLYAGFGAWAMFDVGGALAFMALEDPAVAALNDLRGSYGGINLAVGLYLLWVTIRAADCRIALTVVALLTAGYVAGRLVSIALDGMPPGVVLGYLALEVTLAVVAYVLLKRLPATGPPRSA